MNDLKSMKKKELEKLAKKLDISDRKSLDKEALIEAIAAAQGAASASAPAEAVEGKGAKAKKKGKGDKGKGSKAGKAERSGKVAEAAEVAEVVDEADVAEEADEADVAEEEHERHPFEDDTPLLPPLELGGIPVGYGREHLSLMIQDPTSLFTYWSVARGEGEVAFEGGRAQVRLYDVTEDQEALVRADEVEALAGRWFFHGLAPDRRYRAEFGALTGGAFVARLKSGVGQTPPDQPSRIEDAVFATIEVVEELADRSEDLRQDAPLRPVHPDRHAGASEREHAQVSGGAARPGEAAVEPLRLEPGQEPVYHGQEQRRGRIWGSVSSWPLSGGPSSWSIASTH